MFDDLDPTKLYAAVVYPEEKMIGCVLVQAMAGGNSSIPGLFDVKLWKLAPIPEGAKFMRGTIDEWRAVANKWNGYEKQVNLKQETLDRRNSTRKGLPNIKETPCAAN